MKRSGPLIAIVILGGYVALEAYTIRKASHRMEPAYIHNLLVESRVATELCEASALELEPRFTRTLERATASYRKDLQANDSTLTEQALDQLINQQVASASLTASEAVSTLGCTHKDIKAYFQRYRIYARKTR